MDIQQLGYSFNLFQKVVTEQVFLDFAFIFAVAECDSSKSYLTFYLYKLKPHPKLTYIFFTISSYRILLAQLNRVALPSLFNISLF